jgi:hypothetical protein
MHRFVFALALGLPSWLAAQAPRISRAGDPSVRDDTIYRLAVAPAAHPDDDWIFLLDDGVVILEKDGTGSRTYRYVIQVLSREAAERWGELSFSYVDGRERLRLNWVRVVGADGKVISAQPSHEQESLAPVSEQAPVYTGAKVRRVSLGGVAPGTIVDYSYTTETLKPVLAGDFYSSWRVTTGRVTKRSRFVLEVPRDQRPRLIERNLDFPTRVTERGGRRTYVWATKDLPEIESEPFAADSNGVYMGITVGGWTSWADIARWYADLSRDRYALTPELEARLGEVVAGARTRRDSLAAVHRWVAQDFRYVSLSLGIGGYQPRLPASVLDTKYGDCKDKATLFIALARRMGAEALPVLLSQGGGVDRELPSLRQFDHMIAAVRGPAGYLFLDLTSELTPFGSLPPSEQGEFALIVHPDGRGEEVTLPEEPFGAHGASHVIDGELSADGLFAGRYAEHRTGAFQYSLRSALATPIAAADRPRMARAIANGLFEGAEGDSIVLFDGRDLTSEARVLVYLKNGRAATISGKTAILTLPLANYANRGLVADLEADTNRVFPIAVHEVVGPRVESWSLRVVLPEGWRARLPEAVTVRGVYGAYEARYAQQGRVLEVTRRLSGAGEGIEPPHRIGGLIAWLKDLAKDDVPYLVLEQPE